MLPYFSQSPFSESGESLEQIKAGSLNKLVERLTSSKHPDPVYMKTFLLTYQSFTNPDKLFTKLVERLVGC